MDFKSDFVSPQQEESGPNSPPKQRGGKSWHPETSRLLAAGAGAMASQAVRSNPCCVFPLAQAFYRSWEDGGRGKPLEIVGDPLETPAAAAEPGPASSHSLGLLWVVPAVPKGILCIRDHTQYVSSVYSVALYRWEKIWVRPWRQPEASHSHIPFFSSGRGQAGPRLGIQELPGEEALAPHALLGLLSHTTLDHPPRGSTILSEMSPRTSIINQENTV